MKTKKKNILVQVIFVTLKVVLNSKHDVDITKNQDPYELYNIFKH